MTMRSCLLLLLWWTCCLHAVDGVKMVRCGLSGRPIVTIEQNTTTGDYQYVREDSQLPETPSSMLVRECWCATYIDREPEYCPVEYSVCQVDDDESPIVCTNDGRATGFLRAIWPICLFWFATLVYLFLFSDQGQAAQSFVKQKFCLRGNSELQQQHIGRDVDQLLTHRPDRAAILLRNSILRERRRTYFARNGQPDTTVGPQENEEHSHLHRLLLKIKQYKPPDDPEQPCDFSTSQPTTLQEMDEEAENGVRCAICLTLLDHGDLIGDIPCGHAFHKDCLKDWLLRRNRCPMCQQQDIAIFKLATEKDR